MRALRQHLRQQNRAGEAALPEPHLVFAHVLQLRRRQARFPLGHRFQARVQPHPVEQIIEHAQPGGRITGAGVAPVIGHRHRAKSSAHFRLGRQTQKRASDARQAMPPPGAAMVGLLGRLNKAATLADSIR